jgi:hypothetical protein
MNYSNNLGKIIKESSLNYLKLPFLDVIPRLDVFDMFTNSTNTSVGRKVSTASLLGTIQDSIQLQSGAWFPSCAVVQAIQKFLVVEERAWFQRKTIGLCNSVGIVLTPKFFVYNQVFESISITFCTLRM